MFLFKGERGRNRLFFRTSFCLQAEPSSTSAQFTAATFLIDTGCCTHFNSCDTLAALLTKRIVKDSYPFDYISINLGDKKMQYEVSTDLSDIHNLANVVGLPMLFFSLGIKLKPNHIANFSSDEYRIVRDVVTMEVPFDYL
jgi:hypothetical protein